MVNRSRPLELKGFIPAIILPLQPDFTIDENSLRRHIQRVLGTPGVTGISCNAHSTVVTMCNREQRRRVLQIVCEEVNGKIPVIAGAYGESTGMTIESALEGKQGGADAILIMPPFSFAWGVTAYPQVIFDFFSSIDRAVNIPFIVFQYAHSTNCNYNCQTLVKLSEIRNFAAIKNSVNDPKLYEEEYRCLKETRPEISVLNANDVQLLSYLCIGSDGTLISYGCLATDLLSQMYVAVKGGDLKRAREINELLFPLTEAIYSPPRMNWHTRIKEALVMMGEIESAVAQPFLPTISDQEREKIRKALVACGLMK